MKTFYRNCSSLLLQIGQILLNHLRKHQSHPHTQDMLAQPRRLYNHD